MKRIRLISAVLIFTTMLALAATAQTRPRPGTAAPRPASPTTTPPPQTTASGSVAVPASKIALVDTSMFGDEKAGITRFVNAVQIVDREFQPRQTELTSLQTRIQVIVEDINKLRGNSVVDPKTIQDKQNEGARLQREFDDKKEQGAAAYSKRYQEVVGPISTEIGKALDQFTQQRGITMTLDVSKLLPIMLTVDPATDITTAFIAEFNSKYPATPRP